MNGAVVQIAGIGLVVVANLVNLLIAALFLARVRGRKRLETRLGLIVVAMRRTRISWLRCAGRMSRASRPCGAPADPLDPEMTWTPG